MTRAVFYTATTLDGYIADEQDSLAWLFEQHIEDDGPGGYAEFFKTIGAVVMGATTYRWLRDHLSTSGEAWPYATPSWVFSHREQEALGETVRFVSGTVREHYATIAASAGDRDIWVVGGGDLAGQFADQGLLDRIFVSIAPVTLGAGRPLFPRRHDLELVDVARNGDFVVATYDVRGPRTD